MSFESRMQTVKEIPSKYQKVVCAFMHEMQVKLHAINDSAYYNIPDLIRLIVLCYYYWAIQFTKLGIGVTISGETNNILTKPDSTLESSHDRSAFIADPINSMDDKIIKCKIKITDNGYWSYILFFGICSDLDCDLNGTFYNNNNQYCYFIQNSGHRWKTDMDKGIVRKCTDYDGVWCDDGDTLTLILDLPNSTISFDKNDKSAGICYNDIVRKKDVQYSLVVCVYGNEAIEILDYLNLSCKL